MNGTCWHCGKPFTANHSQTWLCPDCWEVEAAKVEPIDDDYLETTNDEDTQPSAAQRFHTDSDGVTHIMPPEGE